MKPTGNYLLGITLVIISLGCSNNDQDFVAQSDDWLIPPTQVLDGGPGKDGIPSVDNPQMIEADQAIFLNDLDLVVGYLYKGEARAYPHLILDWHEIVNDKIQDRAFALTYCPLTGTAINWNRTLGGLETTFGVSGLLYNSNLIPYDRASDSQWSQMQLRCVNGTRIGEEIEVFPSVETSWKTWRSLFPETKVLSLETGFSRNYGSYPYVTQEGDYRIADYLIFPVSSSDTRLSSKERVHGIINNGDSKAYRFESFSEGVQLIHDVVGGSNVVVVGSKPDNFIVSFYSENETFSLVDRSMLDETLASGVFQDQNGNVYNLFGEVISGPDINSGLMETKSFIGYWFSWAVFYPDIPIHEFQ